MATALEKKIFRLVCEAPTTAPEAGALVYPKLKMRDAMRRASAHLCNLRRDGKIKVVGYVQRDGFNHPKQTANLYAKA